MHNKQNAKHIQNTNLNTRHHVEYDWKHKCMKTYVLESCRLGALGIWPLLVGARLWTGITGLLCIIAVGGSSGSGSTGISTSGNALSEAWSGLSCRWLRRNSWSFSLSSKYDFGALCLSLILAGFNVLLTPTHTDVPVASALRFLEPRSYRILLASCSCSSSACASWELLVSKLHF
jgi:hypothetical protein